MTHTETEPTTRYFLLATSEPDWCQCVCATASLDSGAIERLKKLRSTWEALKKEDAGLCELRVWDAGYITFHRSDDEEEAEEEEAAAAQYAAIFQRYGSMRTFPPVSELMGADIQVRERQVYRTECDQLIIDEVGVAWVGIPKHSDGEIRTEVIPWTTLDTPM